MKLDKLFLLACLFFSITSSASNRKVLVEIFTNSHCPLCPPAHSAINKYIKDGNGDKIEFIYYHMVYPYSTDQIYQASTSDADAKNILYGPYSSTPQAFFNGSHIGNSYNSWEASLNASAEEESSFTINLSGSHTASDITINADIQKLSESTDTDLTINFVIVENVQYQGNNGISSHKNVMRKIANINGDSFTLNTNQNISKSVQFTLNNGWNSDSLNIIAYIQSSSSKKVYQSESISFSQLTLTDVNNEINLPQDFSLEQNYPNPFNPVTLIEYSIPLRDENTNVTLKVYDILGKEIGILVNQKQTPGNYKIEFDASNLSNGVYLYQLKSGSFIKTKKMIVLK